jgi:hypothetical protein
VKTPRCFNCDKSLPKDAARLIVRGWWWCADCVYREEINPNAPELTPASRANPKHPQKETLFNQEHAA